MTNAPAVGDPAPYFFQRSSSSEQFNIDVVAGRYLVLVMIGSAGTAQAQDAIKAVNDNADLFDDARMGLFFTSTDPQDEATGRLKPSLPGRRVFWDADQKVTTLYGANRWVVISPSMRIHMVIPFRPDHSDIAQAMAALRALPDPEVHAGIAMPPPVLVIPNVFEPAFCDHLISLYDADNRDISGFMRQVGGKTVGMNDPRHKVRRDFVVEETNLIKAVQSRFLRRVVPEILKVHQFQVTRMERYLVGCYRAEDGGHFRAHRDNTTSATVHRRFAVSVNLNDSFEGGEVSFPEYSQTGFKAPKGGAVVFSCSLLHAVSPVISGARYAFLPFLYDDAAAKIREANITSLEDGQSHYKA